MDAKREKPESHEVEEPAVSYAVSSSKAMQEDKSAFDFDTEFAKGLTPKQFKAAMFKRIKKYP